MHKYTPYAPRSSCSFIGLANYRVYHVIMIRSTNHVIKRCRTTLCNAGCMPILWFSKVTLKRRPDYHVQVLKILEAAWETCSCDFSITISHHVPVSEKASFEGRTAERTDTEVDFTEYSRPSFRSIIIVVIAIAIARIIRGYVKILQKEYIRCA